MSTARTLLDKAADKLPSPNGVALAIMQLWEDEHATVNQLAHLVQCHRSRHPRANSRSGIGRTTLRRHPSVRAHGRYTKQ